jgi:cytochrome c peroxidase
MINIFRVLLVASLLLAVFSLGAAYANDLTPIELLGKNLFFDEDLSTPPGQSCAACHAPESGWTGPISDINAHGAVYEGAVPTRFGNRKPPSAAYATLSPIFFYWDVEGIFVGGNFWDGRATGEGLGNPAADQALGPFLNPVEQNNPNKQVVCEKVKNSSYAVQWENVWGEPISCIDGAEVEENYDRIGLSIAAYEDSSEVNQYSSKYDAHLRGEIELTDEEMHGEMLFNGKAMCSSCHISEVGPFSEHPLFTDFTYDNLGVPKNPENPFYNMDEEFLDDGSPINPEGDGWIDIGLGGFLSSRPEFADRAAENMGKHKVPTLRNVDSTMCGGVVKAYMHNGFFKSLKEVVHFYNTRDIKEVCPGEYTAAQALAAYCWPPPEVPENVNIGELGDLGLTDSEENAIVAFMKTLSDETAGDTMPPSISCPADTTIECSQSPDPAVTGSASATDTCDSSVAITFADSISPGTCSEETTISRTWTATDAGGNSSSCVQTIEVADTTPPLIESLTVSPDVLWPPNHKLIPVTVSVNASDNCLSSPTASLVSIRMNEGDETNTFDPSYDSTVGEGHTNSDIQVDENGNIYLRAERSGSGNGRIYTITYSVNDSCGNSSLADVTVTVPHNQ